MHEVVDEVRSASFHGRRGDLPQVRREQNDLERLELDVQECLGSYPAGVRR